MRSIGWVRGSFVCLTSLLGLVNCALEGAESEAAGPDVAAVAVALEAAASVRGAVPPATCDGASVEVTGGGAVRTVVASQPSCTPGATPHYRFVVVAPNNAETLLHDWSPRSQVFWNVAGLNGVYRVRLEVRAAKNPRQRPALSEAQLGLGRLCSDPTVVGLAPAYLRGEPVPLRAEASCGAPEFRFWVRSAESEAWLDACGRWTRGVGCDWTPPEGSPAGAYEAKVQARWAGSVGIEFEGESTPRAFMLNDDPGCNDSGHACEL
jgi:hypothetical protein